MRKLSLKLDELVVESFAAANSGAPRGTAYAHGDTVAEPDNGTDPVAATRSCMGTCDGQTFCIEC